MSVFSTLFDPLEKPAPSATDTLQAPHEEDATVDPAQPQEQAESANLALLEAAEAYFAFHLFAAHFPSQAEAERFAFEQWEPEPAADASDAEFSAWEARNPSWRLRQELGYYMDADFVELIGKDDCPQYLDSLIRSDAEQQRLRSRIKAHYSHFIIVGSESIDGDQRSVASGPNQRPPQSTPTLDYLGEFNGSSAPR